MRIDIRHHTNFKYAIKNRLPLPNEYNFGSFYLVIKNDSGQFADYNGDWRAAQFTWWSDQAFLIAKECNGKVYIQTSVGDIEIFERDFK
jgi:hypothetical protein